MVCPKGKPTKPTYQHSLQKCFKKINNRAEKMMWMYPAEKIDKILLEARFDNCANKSLQSNCMMADDFHKVEFFSSKRPIPVHFSFSASSRYCLKCVTMAFTRCVMKRPFQCDKQRVKFQLNCVLEKLISSYYTHLLPLINIIIFCNYVNWIDFPSNRCARWFDDDHHHIPMQIVDLFLCRGI